MPHRHPRVQLWEGTHTGPPPLGLKGPACPERASLDQNTPPGRTPCQAMCRWCGRVTARRDANRAPSCRGEL